MPKKGISFVSVLLCTLLLLVSCGEGFPPSQMSFNPDPELQESLDERTKLQPYKIVFNKNETKANCENGCVPTYLTDQETHTKVCRICGKILAPAEKHLRTTLKECYNYSHERIGAIHLQGKIYTYIATIGCAVCNTPLIDEYTHFETEEITEKAEETEVIEETDVNPDSSESEGGNE